MSRPNISYPTPLPSTSFDESSQPLGPSPMVPEMSSRRPSGHRGSNSQGRSGGGSIDSHITRLLVTTKQLLQGLELWCTRTMDEEGVSDIYVRLGNGFESTVAALQRCRISTADLDSIPHDLRICLEQCLAEEPCQETLNTYLPEIRQIISSLLQGLKQKQAIYKRQISDRQAPEIASNAATRPAPLPPPNTADDRLSARSIASNATSGSGSPASVSSNLPPVKQPSSMALAERARGGLPSRPAPPDAFRPARTREVSQKGAPSPQPQYPTPLLPPTSELPRLPQLPQIVRHQLSDNPVPSPPPITTSFPSSSTQSRPTPPRPDRFSRDSFGNPRPISRFSVDSDITNGSPIRSPESRSPPPQISMTLPSLPEITEFSIEVSDHSGPYEGGSRASLSGSGGGMSSGLGGQGELNGDRGVADRQDQRTGEGRGEGTVEDKRGGGAGEGEGIMSQTGTQERPTRVNGPDPTITPEPFPIPGIPKEARATLAALERSDGLERRASKRYSSYTFNKLPGGSPGSHKKSASALAGGSGSPQRPTRRADRAPPMPAMRESLALQNLASSAGLGQGEKSLGLGEPGGLLQVNGSTNGDAVGEGSGGLQRDRSTSPTLSARSRTSTGDHSTGSIRVLKTPEPAEDAVSHSTPRAGNIHASTSTEQSSRVESPTQVSPAPTSTRIYLRIGRKVKKAQMEPPFTLDSIKLLFMEKFDYDAGRGDFPNVCVRDPKSGVQYELELMEDVVEGCLLCLDIEPFDQMRQYLDTTVIKMMSELRAEVKMMAEKTRRNSITPASSLLAVSPSSHFRGPALPPIESPVLQPVSPSQAPQQPAQPLAASSSSAATRAQLQTHYETVQTLRRDLAVVRQVHLDFLAESRTTFADLRTQNDSMREVLKTKLGGSRPLLDNAKIKIEETCNETIAAVDEISEIIDQAREDAARRSVTPTSKQMIKIKGDLAKAKSMIEEFGKELQGAEGTARSTWVMELHRVTEEQKTLDHQKKLVVDLKKDVEDAEVMFGNITDFVNQRGVGVSGRVGGGGGGRGYRPPSPDAEGGGVGNLLMEIRTKEGDPNQRLKAIEAQQKARERERENNKTDEFGDELAGFVQGRKLKKTGGTDEVERNRQRKQEVVLKRMMTGDSVTDGGANGGGLSPQMTGTSRGGLTPQITGASVASTVQGKSLQEELGETLEAKK